MATKKITVTIDEVELRLIREQVASGQASSVSGFVQEAVRQALDAERLWAEYLDDVLEKTGGPLTDEERAWVDGIFGSSDESGSK